ncbi:hypothetical protein K239x_56110 [Planctomycetes bacterium K23_9]|uniref:Uncharacterized protein n=2 Tax=Stieleria marina TaxID=1930275 RepID=A0A517P2J5_9BACT|nr:hypothetical protein K239x_56110 [Planctomycetes bacterium K23_9]
MPSQLINMPIADMLSISPTYLLHYLPLIVAISLVFGATRHEDTALILKHSFHTARWITGFMAFIFVVLAFISWLI